MGRVRIVEAQQFKCLHNDHDARGEPPPRALDRRRWLGRAGASSTSLRPVGRASDKDLAFFADCLLDLFVGDVVAKKHLIMGFA